MRTLNGKKAPVIPIARAIRRPVSLTAGIADSGVDGPAHIYVEIDGKRFRMTADQAESHASDLMQFVYELRNGGQLV